MDDSVSWLWGCELSHIKADLLVNNNLNVILAIETIQGIAGKILWSIVSVLGKFLKSR